QDWSVVREDGSYRILGAPGNVAAVGRRVLRLVDAGDLTAAHRWMTWVSPQQSAPPEAMPMQVAYVRARNAGTNGDAAATRMAAALMSLSDASDGLLAQLLGILQTARAATKDPVLADALAADIAVGYAKLKRFDQVLPLAEQLVSRHGDIVPFVQMRLDM